MSEPTGVQNCPDAGGIPISETFTVEARAIEPSGQSTSVSIPAYATNVANVNIARNEFNKYPIAVASLDVEPGKSVEVRVRYTSEAITAAKVRPVSLGINTKVEGDTVTFILDRVVDVMLEVNNDKWKALHILANEIDRNAPTADAENIWYFGPGINNGSAYSQVVDGNLKVPSDLTVYLSSGAFVTASFIFEEVSNSGIRGPGFIYNEPVVHSDRSRPRELTDMAILIERSESIFVEGVTSLGAKAFSLPVGQSRNIHINHYRSFSSAGNGDGIDLFCSCDVLIENCFLRNSDDTIAIYGHRWDYYGDTSNIRIRNCTLLPDIAHPIQIGTHGNPGKPETFSNIHISDIDILDHYENQMWYQGCISINAGDENLIEDVLVENIRVEKISKGQLVNIRVMKNAMWTTAPGRGVRNVTLRNVELNTGNSETVNPSQILGFDASRKVENVTFENLKIEGKYVHNGMQKPRWYMVSDLVPMFINEHVKDVKFRLTKEGEKV
ncbi:glycoside hydrolase family 28 protein [Lophiotrema nucula]|uniref:Glycoside hydrolase family 28 protein n=1 Tax=Lophiotrema nucula TaxID=690887 RepID=A0A6A5Z097_9PLEO|nr:glycoside hydrolase family 28 protein [Lophiotrema nucula]